MYLEKDAQSMNINIDNLGNVSINADMDEEGIKLSIYALCMALADEYGMSNEEIFEYLFNQGGVVYEA